MINDNFLCKNIEKTNNKQLYLFHYFTVVPLLPKQFAIRQKKRSLKRLLIFSSCGGLTRTDDLWVMSPTSYQLLHSAMLSLICECKGTALNCKKQIFEQKNQANEVKEVKRIMKILLKSLQFTHTKQNLIKQKKRDKG